VNYFRYFILLLVSLILQVTIIKFIAVSPFNIAPDIVFLAIIYIAVKEGSLSGSLFGFSAGLFIDIISGSFVGLCALLYSIFGFASGYLKRDEDKLLKKYNFLVITLIFTLLNFLIYYFIYFQGTSLTFLDILVRYIIPTSAYTSLFSLFYIFLIIKRKVISGY